MEFTSKYSRQGNTSTIKHLYIYIYIWCGRIVYGAEHRTKRFVLKCNNRVSTNFINGDGEQKQLSAQRSNSNTVGSNCRSRGINVYIISLITLKRLYYWHISCMFDFIHIPNKLVSICSHRNWNKKLICTNHRQTLSLKDVSSISPWEGLEL